MIIMIIFFSQGDFYKQRLSDINDGLVFFFFFFKISKPYVFR